MVTGRGKPDNESFPCIVQRIMNSWPVRETFYFDSLLVTRVMELTQESRARPEHHQQLLNVASIC